MLRPRMLLVGQSRLAIQLITVADHGRRSTAERGCT